MTEINTLRDLRVSGVVSLRDVDKIAASIFTGTTEVFGGIEGYVVTLPDYDELPDTCKQFIRKALVFSTVQNVLDHDAEHAAVEPSSEDPGSHYALVEDPEVYDDEDEDPPGHSAP